MVEELLGLGHALLGHRDRLVLLVELVVEVGHELLLGPRVHALGRLAGLQHRRQPRELRVQVGGLLGGPGDDQRRARLVDQDVVDLVDDRERACGERTAVLVEAPAVLDLLLDRVGHVVAQVVEAELGVRAVRDVAGVGGLLVLVGLHVLQHADRHPEPLIDRAHPLGVATGQVVVDGDDVDAVAAQAVERDGERSGQRLALAGLHLGDVAAVQDHAADQLHVEVAHAHRPPADLSRDRERLRQHVIERRARLRALTQLAEALAQLVVGLELELGLERADQLDALLVLLELLRLADIQRPLENPHGSLSVDATRGLLRCLPAASRGRARSAGRGRRSRPPVPRRRAADRPRRGVQPAV